MGAHKRGGRKFGTIGELGEQATSRSTMASWARKDDFIASEVAWTVAQSATHAKKQSAETSAMPRLD
jgi:hypothetical protein